MDCNRVPFTLFLVHCSQLLLLGRWAEQSGKWHREHRCWGHRKFSFVIVGGSRCGCDFAGFRLRCGFFVAALLPCATAVGFGFAAGGCYVLLLDLDLVLHVN